MSLMYTKLINNITTILVLILLILHEGIAERCHTYVHASVLPSILQTLKFEGLQ